MSHRIRIASTVNHERLDDEVIAINIDSGVYFAMDDAAADCWSVAVDGGGVDEMVDVLVARYEVEPAVARTDAEAFVAALVAQRLAEATEEPASQLAPPAPATGGRLAYRRPELEGYDDLESLLLIDPIHEVDDAGWPMPAAGGADGA